MLKIQIMILLSLFINASSILAMAIEVQGHRGCRGNLPENTLPAFEKALNAGADVLEMDLAVTKDGVLVISHDPHINAEICLNADGSALNDAPLINQLTLAEVKAFDCGSIKHPRFENQIPRPGTPIPTLDEVFALVRESKHKNAQRIGFNIETKIFPDHPEYTIGPDEFSEKVVEAFKKSGFLSRITLQSFDFRTLVKAKELAPSLKTVALIENETIDMVAKGQELKAFAVSPDFNLLTKKLVEELHQASLKIIPWTLNSEGDWSKAIDMQVDGIITDYPEDLIHYLAKTS